MQNYVRSKIEVSRDDRRPKSKKQDEIQTNKWKKQHFRVKSGIIFSLLLNVTLHKKYLFLLCFPAV